MNFVQIRDDIREWVSTTSPGSVSVDDAVELTRIFSDIERGFTAAKLKMALRAEQCGAHKEDGHKNSGTWLSSITGDPTGRSMAGLEAARAAEKHPEIDDAFKKGELGVERVREIASAADVCPEETASLVNASREMTFKELQNTCGSVREAASSREDEITNHERVHARRYFRSWTDYEGAGRIEALLTKDALGLVLSALEPYKDQAFAEARKAGKNESQQAYMADAFVEMARASKSGKGKDGVVGGGGGKSKPLVRIRADLAALRRGYREKGERCEIPGVGQIPVAVAREVLGDCFLELVLTDGIDVSTVVTDTRTIRRALRVAIEERDLLKCCVRGCDQTVNLQIDHYLRDFAKGGLTCEANLLTYCSWHHQEKTNGHFRAEGTPQDLKYTNTKKSTRLRQPVPDFNAEYVPELDDDVDLDPPPTDRLF